MKHLIGLLVIFMLFSCTAKKEIRYFEDLKSVKELPFPNVVQTVYLPNDLIIIRVSSPTNVGVEPFNLTGTSYLQDDGVGTLTTETRPYLIKSDGTIDFPIIGPIQIAGLTKQEAIAQIKEYLLPYIDEPRVEIEMVNYNISVLGDVSNPGVYKVENERITILEAFALAGDLNITGKRNNILIIRESEGKKKFLRANLLSDSIFQPEIYYLKQNDVLYVEPNILKTREAGWESRLPIFTSIIALSLSIYTFLLR